MVHAGGDPGAVAIQVLLWFGVFFYTAEHTNPKGDGMEWVGIMPASFVLAIGTLLGCACATALGCFR